MNRVFDYNGTLVAPSKPVKTLRTVKKTLHIDSADRDTTKYYTNGDVVYYLPRVYENVVSIRLKGATFPRVVSETSEGALAHPYSPATTSVGDSKGGSNVPSSDFTKDDPATSAVKYFVVELEGLNKSDETTVAANRSTFPDSFFAKIPLNLAQNTSSSYFINYNDHTDEENIAKYTPAIGKLDRIRVVTRLHSQQGRTGFIYWTSDGTYANGTKERAVSAQYSLTLELEMLDNTFDEFSSFETRLSNRDVGANWS
jgi:hypothetical protein